MVPGPLRHLLFLSPHCDDVVFACGGVLESHPGSVVATVCAGRPGTVSAVTEWDAAAGFGPHDDVMAERRAEDLAALSLLGAWPLWLDFLDHQYQPAHEPRDLQRAIDALVRAIRPHALFIPLGLFHSDHRAVHEAALQVSLVHRSLASFLYEDALYRRIPGLVDQRLTALAEAGFSMTPVSFPSRDPSERKMQAIRRYRSQLRALTTRGRPGYLDAVSPERYWRLTCAL
jgi:LmbE family N-acetylglucosaminyl deacetylase